MAQLMLINRQAGISLIEILVAMAIFLVVASTGAMLVTGSFAVGRLSEEQTAATQIASEGIAAVRSIQEQSWTDISPGVYGLALSGGNWVLGGSPDVDPSGKYTRTVTIEEVYRDTTGAIVGSGITDPETLKVSISVSWNFSPLRNNQVSLVSYLTNWRSGAEYSGGAAQPSGCTTACTNAGKSGGSCLISEAACVLSGMSYESIGDTACSRGTSQDYCCCTP